MAPRIWQTWLPDDVARLAEREEPSRFAALSSCVVREVESALHDQFDPNRWHRLVKWLCHINTFNNLHQDYPAEHLVPLARALWQGVAESWRDLEAQVRLTDCLTKLLKTHKRTLRRARLVLPWRPLMGVLQRLHGLPLPKLEGVGLLMARGTALVKLVAKARRYFPPGALGEVWEELRPAIRAVGRRPSEGYEALGYLQLFAPTHNICSLKWSDVNGWLLEWFTAWDGSANSSAWDSLWLALLSRAAKHDWRGIIDWRPHLPHLFASFVPLFDVPVGPSRGITDVINRAAPGRAGVLFSDQMGYGSFHAARLAVHLLRCTADPVRGPPTSASASEAAAQLEHLTALLEQYYHPSNTGKWCKELATLLKHLVKVAVKQLERQQPPPPSSESLPPSATASGGGAAAPGAASLPPSSSLPFGHITNDDLGEEFEYMQIEVDEGAVGGDGDGGGGGEGATAASAVPVVTSDAATRCGPRPWVSELREPELQRLAACCLKLAARGQFSKDSTIANVSIKALSQLALLNPHRVLPLVTERFRAALATATATHQLVAATATLAMCVRPMLLSGWEAGVGAAEGRGPDGGLGGDVGVGAEVERETAAQLVSEALMAALPGLDANDEPKTNAVLQLYVTVVSALPRLRGAGEEEEDDEVAAREEEEEQAFARQPGTSSSPQETSAAATAMDVGGAASAASSSGGGSELTLSLYVAEWAEEVLERCLALLQNLDSGPGHRATDMASKWDAGAASTSAFLTGARSLFGPLWQLLFHHTRPSVRRHLVRRLAGFVLGATASGVAAEVATIAAQAASAAPREALRTLMLPLLARMEAEVEELPRLDLDLDVTPEVAADSAVEAGRGQTAAGPAAPSFGREATLRYQLAILTESLNQLHADHLLAPDMHIALGLPALGPPQAQAQRQRQQGPGQSVLPPGSLAARVLALADRLMGVNSLVLQEEASTLGAVVVMAFPRYWLEPHLPWRYPAGRPGGAGPALPLVPDRGVELWIDKYGSGYQKPRWRSPSPAHVAVAQQLTVERLLAPMRRLMARLAGEGAGGWSGDAAAKLRLRGELLRMRGLLLHSLSMLRDFQFAEEQPAAAGGEGGGVSLAVAGALGATVGDPGVREQLAEALVEVGSALGPSADPELLHLVARCGGVLLAAGSIEYVGAQADERNQRATAHLYSDGPATSRLVPGLVWRRRSPQWLVQSRLFNGVMARASAGAFRSWATTQQPELTRLQQFPSAYLALLRSLCLLSQHPNAALAHTAASAVDVATKRFPCLAPAFLPYFLGAIAEVPYDMSLVTRDPPLDDFFARVREAAFGGAAAGEAGAPAPVGESERNGRVKGSCSVINTTLSFWRLICRRPEWLAAALEALLAARVHNASVPQKALGDLLINFAGRILHPPAMSYSSDGGPSRYVDLVRAVVELARPGAMTRRGGTFRYTIIANAMLTLLLPHRYGPAAAAGVSDYGGGADGEVAALLLRHMLGLLVGADAPQLRQLGMSGTFLPLVAVEEYRAPLPHLVEVLREAITQGTAGPADPPLLPGQGQGLAAAAEKPAATASEWAVVGDEVGSGSLGSLRSSGGSGWGWRLVHSLVHSHTDLDNAEAMKDKRGGAGMLALQQILNMTFEEMAAGLASLPLDRLAKWPNDGLSAPAAVTEGTFVVRHARLVQLLAAAAPAEMLSALRAPLEALTTPDRLTAAVNISDKAEMATAAEVLAGLIASGAPWAPAPAAGDTAPGTAPGTASGGDGGWALAALARAVRGTCLDMSPSWAVSYRYAVRGLLDGLVPERLHSAVPPAPDRALPPQPPLAAGLTPETLGEALGQVLGLTVRLPGRAPSPVAEVDPATAAANGGGGGTGGGGLPAQLKRLRCVGMVVRELSGLDPERELPVQVRDFWSGLLEELHATAASPDCLSLREQLQGPFIDALAYFEAGEGLLAALRQQEQAAAAVGVRSLGRGPGRGNGNGNGNGNGASSGEGELVHVSKEPSGMSTPAEVEVELGGGGTDAVLLVLPSHHHDSLQELRNRARGLALAMATRFNAAAARVQDSRATEAALTAAATTVAAAAAETPSTPAHVSAGGAADSPASRATTDDLVMVDVLGATSASASASETTSPGRAGAVTVAMDVDAVPAATASGSAAWQLGLGLEVQLYAAARHRSPGLRELVIAMLPGLLRLQDVPGPELQKFAKESRAALLVVRCLSLNTHAPGGAAAAMLAAALDSLSAAAVVEVPWSARAAALSYSQTLWFRHAPLLGAEQLRHLQDVVSARLQDAKAEVRSLAAATLSGLLLGTSPEDVGVLRNQLLQKAASLFGAGRGRRRRGSSVASTVASTAAAPVTGPNGPQQPQLEKLGCVAGLSALLMSCPYDVPKWVSPVLMALVRAAGGGEQDGAVRSEAGRALGEFRRTHEAEALEELRGRMDPDDWDSLTQATGTSSYFV